MEYTLIKSGSLLPGDFVINGVLNREKYIIECGFSDKEKWYSEFATPVNVEVIGAIIIGSNFYCDFRWRQRTESDERWDLTKTTIAKMMNAGR
jgi:hypothetical protein